MRLILIVREITLTCVFIYSQHGSRRGAAMIPLKRRLKQKSQVTCPMSPNMEVSEL